MDYVFIDNSVDNMKALNSKLGSFNGILHDRIRTGSFPSECVDIILGLTCYNSFPLCDYSSETPQPRKVCSYIDNCL